MTVHYSPSLTTRRLVVRVKGEEGAHDLADFA